MSTAWILCAFVSLLACVALAAALVRVPEWRPFCGFALAGWALALWACLVNYLREVRL